MSKNTGLVHASGKPITTADVARARASSVGFGVSNEGASRRGTFMAGWRPGLRSADADWLTDRNDVVARARDLQRNDVVASSAVARRVSTAVGLQWRLSSKVNARALGITPDQARELRAEIETAFRGFAYGYAFQCDAERKKTFGQLLRLGAAHIFSDGEALGLIEYARGETTKYKTRLRMVDPDRLGNPSGIPDSPTLRGGVERNLVGVPVAYHIREQHPNDIGLNTGAMTWRRWARYSTKLDRPQVLHAFDEMRAGQSRGISRLVAALKSFRALSKFTDATLEVATINALIVATIKSSAGPDAVSESFSVEDYSELLAERDNFYDATPASIDGVQIPVLPVGDELDLKSAARDTGGFDAFVRAVLRLIAAALGLTYEEMSMDFSQTNYSSARAALAVAWGETITFRGLIAAQLATPLYVAWLEEAIDIGEVKLPAGAPDFYDAIDAYSECKWVGPGRGYIDPTKEIDAASARIEAGMSTLEDECAEQGKDWEEVLEQLAREQAVREQLGLAAASSPSSAGAVAESARDENRDQRLDERPESALARVAAFAKGALARVRRTARSADHERFLDQRP